MPSSAIQVPSFKNGFARSAGESRFPQLWRGLVGAWCPSLGPTGNVLHDWSGRWRRGTLTSMDPATDWVVSGQQYALDFDGSNDHVIGSVPISGASECTLAFWASIATGQSSKFLVSIPTNSAGGVNGVDIYLSGSTSVTAYLYTTSGNSISTTYSYAGAGWIHFANTYDGVTHRLYINGQPQVSAARSGAINAGSNELNLGRFGAAGLYAACQLDDVRVYNKAAVASEIRLLALRRGIAYEARGSSIFPRIATGSPWYYYAQQAVTA